ncbi:DJ-1/PfpI family protein [Actinopolyspora mzabensis]
MRSRNVLVVLFEGVQSLDVTGPLEVFAGANERQTSGGGEPEYVVHTAALDARPVRTSSGLLLTPDRDLREVSAPDLLLVPGGVGTRTPCPELVDWIRWAAPRIERIVSVCTGAFLLAEAGVLSGRRATTHWAHCESLANRFPDIEVVAEPIFVRDGGVATSAGVTTGIDLALALVEEDLNRDTALLIARYLVVFLRRPGNQPQFSAPLANQTARREPLRDLQQWIVEHPASDLSVAALARRANLSPRQFARSFSSEVGIPPGRYVDRVRLDAARRALGDTGAEIAEIARHCGFGTTETMRRVFLRDLGVSPSEYRDRLRCESSLV